ncbi:hypothetical protein ACFTZK_06620 [Streptomyces decoyicus]|uniref:hypothetical protein n=1 Tax=Streptomyces decoyicus TaxID=249567 RepID=UPI00362C6378
MPFRPAPVVVRPQTPGLPQMQYDGPAATAGAGMRRTARALPRALKDGPEGAGHTPRTHNKAQVDDLGLN